MTSVLSLFVHAKHKIGHDDLVGSTTGTIESFLADGASEGRLCSQVFISSIPHSTVLSSAITRTLSKLAADENLSQTQPIIEFSITVESQPSNTSYVEMSDGVRRATTAFEQMTVAPSTLERIEDAVGTSTTIVGNMKSITATWDPLIQRIKLFTEIVDRISEV
jgi:hypothetical protein